MQEFSTEAFAELADRRGLVFPRRLLGEIVAELDAGKHIMLTGAPGTGKTSLAYLAADLARDALQCTGYLAVTANSDWGAGEMIGRYAATPEGEVFEPGFFLQAIQSGSWLVIDELNRADFDRAFGPLFTVMANEPVTLPFRQVGHSRPMSIVPIDAVTPPNTEEVRIPRSWRMIATMNEFDKATLYRLSYALMRRFAFIEVETPPDDVIRRLVAGAGDLVAALLPVREFIELGAAVFVDAARYVERRREDPGITSSRVLFETFYGYFLPQLDRLDDAEARNLYEVLSPLFDRAEANDLRHALRKLVGLSTQPNRAAAGVVGATLPGSLGPSR